MPAVRAGCGVEGVGEKGDGEGGEQSDVAKVRDGDLEGGSVGGTYREEFRQAVLKTDLEDVEAVLAATRARFVLGVSVGAILALELGLRKGTTRERGGNGVERMVVFEPPLQFVDVDTGLDVQGVRRFEDE